MLTKEGWDGDTVCDSRYHGGPDQAVYVYGNNDYEWWSDKLGRKLSPGIFGDNLTIEGLSCRDIFIGDRFKIRNVEIEATGPRILCRTFSNHMHDPIFAIAFRDAALPGFYCRVISTGPLNSGDGVIHKKRDRTEKTISVDEIFNLYYNRNLSYESLKCALAAPISYRDRNRLVDRMSKLRIH